MRKTEEIMAFPSCNNGEKVTERVTGGRRGRIHVKELNDVLICTLCNGYFVDATTLIECLHVFCRGCILRHFENSKGECPTCKTVCKKKNQPCLRPDPQIQALVYKLVPGLYPREIQRREDFYRSTGVRASSSCSDDSVLERERDLIINDQEAQVAAYVGDKTQFFGPEDLISLSLEYYQWHLDSSKSDKTKVIEQKNETSETTVVAKQHNNTSNKVNGSRNCDLTGAAGLCDGKVDVQNINNNDNNNGERRFLQCPAGVTMRHLQKFVRMKNALSANHRVDIIYEGEVLPVHFSLMDVAYSFKWIRVKPMRFFYRIFTPLKIQPIKIVKTALSSGGKQLQVVNKTNEVSTSLPPPPPPPPTTCSSLPVGAKLTTTPSSVTTDVCNDSKGKTVVFKEDMTRKESEEKERLLSNLQLQSRTKVESSTSAASIASIPVNHHGSGKSIRECVFDYGEPDKDEEIKKFAETRDREWAMMHHFSKKRKKSKHSSRDFGVYKKRKLHAEITNNKEEELKLKVKLTPHNGHKHKHHKSSSSSSNNNPLLGEMSSKEKILQMRQVRHKHVPSEDKNVQTNNQRVGNKDGGTDQQLPPSPLVTKKKKVEFRDTTLTNGKSEEVKKLSQSVEKREVPVKPKEWVNSRVPTVQLERNEQTEQQAKKTFLTKQQTFHQVTFPGNDKTNNKSQQQQQKEQLVQKVAALQHVTKQPSTVNKPVTIGNSQFERKIANLQQRCTIEAKSTSTDKKSIEGATINTKPKLLNPSCPPGFTVSKIESGVNKRKIETNAEEKDKRPSLEITLISPNNTSDNKPQVAKRPPPATIPLERIKKCINSKTGLSIFPKLGETKCDNIGALDLSSKPSILNSKMLLEIHQKNLQSQQKTLKVYGLAQSNNNSSRQEATSSKSSVNAMSNLQMLSKVATEHPNLNNKPVAPSSANPKPQLPNLQTLKIPQRHPQNATNPNVPKSIPKLTEINKSNYRFTSANPPIRNLRPNQNQNIRNIPNPSLLVRQQNQNRLNSLNSVTHSSTATTTSPQTSNASLPTTTGNKTITAVVVKNAKSDADKVSAVAASPAAPPIMKKSDVVMVTTTTSSSTNTIVSSSTKIAPTASEPKLAEEEAKATEPVKEG